MQKKALWSFLLGGVLPLVAYAIVEDQYGPFWGTVAGMSLGLVEVLWEWRRDGRVQTITWGSNLMILVLGVVSIVTNDGLWFKMQPSLLEIAVSITLWVSAWRGPGILVLMARKQNPNLPEAVVPWLRSLSIRLGFFFLAHSILNAWAALHWSTAAWVMLKGIGLTISQILYIIIEVLWKRYRSKKD